MLAALFFSEKTEGVALWRYNPPAMKRNVLRGLVDIGFIIFLFYSNLLMGEFERSGLARRKGFLWALTDVFTMSNLAIAIVAAVIGYALVERLRTRL